MDTDMEYDFDQKRTKFEVIGMGQMQQQLPQQQICMLPVKPSNVPSVGIFPQQPQQSMERNINNNGAGSSNSNQAVIEELARDLKNVTNEFKQYRAKMEERFRENNALITKRAKEIKALKSHFANYRCCMRQKLKQMSAECNSDKDKTSSRLNDLRNKLQRILLCVYKVRNASWCRERSDKMVEIIEGGTMALLKGSKPDISYLLTTKSPFYCTPHSPGSYGTFYYELTIKLLPNDGEIALGFCRDPTQSKSNIFCFGNKAYTKKWGTDDEWVEDGELKFGQGDKVGVGLVVMPPSRRNNGCGNNSKKLLAFLTVNGVAGRHFHAGSGELNKVWPMVELCDIGTLVESNFGHDAANPFAYSILKHPLA